MKYLLIQSITLIITVTIMYYISRLGYFLPWGIDGDPNWYNITYVMFLLFLIIESFSSILIYLSQKFIIYGRKEFPEKGFSIKWGLIIATVIISILLLNVFHILSLVWGLILLMVVVLIAIFVR